MNDEAVGGEVIFESSDLLQDMWKDINHACFESKLSPPASIGWIDFSSEPGMDEPYGIFLVTQNSIGISRRFHKLVEKASEFKRVIAATPKESPERIAAEESLLPIH